MNKAVRWGVLGAANFARVHLAPAIHEAEGAVFDAIATRDREKAAPFLRFAPDLRVFDDYDALLADERIEAVYIPLPNTMHVDWTVQALEAGKHVLVEKPAAMHASEFDRLIAARDRAGRLASEAYMIVHHPQWQLAKDLLAAGECGEIRHVQGGFTFDNEADVGNIRNRKETGGGALRDIGVYPFGATRFVTGQEPETLSAEIEWQNGIDVTSHVRARFPGFTFSTYLSIRMAPRQEMVIHGRDAVMRLTAPFNAGVFGEGQLYIRRADGVELMHRFPRARQYTLQIEAFCRSIRQGAPWPLPLEWSRGTQAMIDAAFDSAQ